MADRTIGIKAGSLARRVFYGSILLLGLPLLVHTIFLYRREYRENIGDAFQMLQQMAQSTTLYLEGTIQHQQDLLGAIANDLSPSLKEGFLESEAKEYHLNALSFIAYEGGHFSCSAPLCTEPSFTPFLQEAVQRERFVFMNPQEANPSLYVGKTIPSSGMPKGLLLVITPMSALLDAISRLDTNVYPTRFSLIDESGMIFFSTEPNLRGSHLAKSSDLLFWKPQSSVPNAWFLEMGGKEFLTVKQAIEGTDYMLLLDVSEESIAALQKRDYFFRIASFLLFVLLIGGVALAYLTKLISRPLRSLAHVMQRVSEGALHIRFTPDWMGFEINVLGKQFNQMLDSLLLHQQEAQRERIARERLAAELKIGHEIQASILGVLPTDFPHLEIVPGYLPAREVSGDFYDLYPLKDGRLLIAIADAAGKGISACLFSIGFRSMLRTAAANTTDLAEAVKTANQMLLLDTLTSSTFITAWIGIYDPKSRELIYCNQGHPHALLCKGKEELIELPSRGIALGVQEIDPKVERIILQPKELLLLYTDGVIEAHDPSAHLFGLPRLKELLHRSKKNDAQQLVDQLLDEIHLFSSGTPQADDITLLALLVR